MLRWLALFATGCVVPVAIPSVKGDVGYSAVDHRLASRIGTHVAGYRLDENAGWDLGGGVTLAETFDPMTTTVTRGGYLEAAWLRRIDGSTRLSLGPGISIGKRDDGTLERVAYLRGGIELFSRALGAGSGSGNCGALTGAWFGQIGIGAYMDVEQSLDGAGVTVIAGLSVRLPAFAGVALVIPGCH